MATAPSSAPSRSGTSDRFGGGYGGFLAPNKEPAPAPPAAAAGSGFGFNLAASYQRIRQLGVTHLLGVPIGGGIPWTPENVRRAVQSAKEAGLVAYNSMIGVPRGIIYAEKPEPSRWSRSMPPSRPPKGACRSGRVQLLRPPRD